MAGSRKYFGYTDDQARVWAIELDETHGEAGVFGLLQAVPPVSLDEGRILSKTSKKVLEPRYVIMKGADSNGDIVTRQFTVGAVTASVWTSPRTSPYAADGILFDVTALIGEKRYLVPAQDTGITDGDLDGNIATP